MHRFLRVSLIVASLPLVRGWSADPVTPTRRADAAAGSVWVAKSSTGGRLYLCGTIHILRQSDYPLAPAYDAAYADSQKLVFELPPADSKGPELNSRMQQLAALPAGTSLESLVGQELTDAVTKWAGSHGLSAGAISKFQPWYLALLIAASEYSALGAQPDKGVDNHFEVRAAKDKKPGEGLETIDFQIGLFTRLSPERQKDLLKQTLTEVKTLPDEFARLITAWKDGDLDALHQMLYREAAQFPELMDLFLHDRNKAWAERLDASLKKGEHVMLLVGTGHFTGPQGLIALLKAKGYSVERYKNAPP
ncbi:MAG: TraB/GumN family protein [Verrucomicrobiaceae bacterium]|nr:TraB/GumN family protein [Verrucomicrobiaceae bacterium]